MLASRFVKMNKINVILNKGRGILKGSVIKNKTKNQCFNNILA